MNGFIEQWGTVTYSHSYAVRFSNQAVPLLRPYVQETSSDFDRFIQTSTNTYFNVIVKWGDYTTSNNTIPLEWYAIGY